MVNALLSKTPRIKSLGFFTPAEASRIAQVPQWTVNSWRRGGIVIPSVEWIDELDKVHIGHTFETVVFLRLIRMLRDKSITLLESVKAVNQLRRRFGVPSKKWFNVKIWVAAKDVFVNDYRDGWDSTVLTKGHQKVAEFFFGEEFRLLKDRADALLIPEQFMQYVEIDPAIKNGLPIVLGTSVTTSLIHKLRQRKCNYRDIHDMYPFIPRNKIIGAEKYEIFLDKVTQN